MYRVMGAPAVVWYLLFLAAPLIVLLVVSLGRRSPNGGYQPGLTLEQYGQLGTRWTAFANTVELGLVGTVVCLMVAYPMAYVLATRGGRYKTILLALVVVPFWTSLLIRTYAWVFLLGNSGIPALLRDLGIAEGVRLLNTPFAVVLGIVYNYLPLMILPIFVSLDRIDQGIRQASKDLGAGPARTFLRITLPLSAPGIISGVLLVFVPVLGEYLIPVLLGGGQIYFLGNALADLFFQSRNWPFGAAVATAFIALVMVLIGFYRKAASRLAPGTEQEGML
ncbi:MAG: ABC transporter permease [Actinobacteria bacterium]|nr:ABC transporter permease [Actinomycetota bacterium]